MDNVKIKEQWFYEEDGDIMSKVVMFYTDIEGEENIEKTLDAAVDEYLGNTGSNDTDEDFIYEEHSFIQDDGIASDNRMRIITMGLDKMKFEDFDGQKVTDGGYTKDLMNHK